MIDLDTSDIQIICALRDDSRLSLRDLGAKANLSAPAVASRLKRLESSGVIKAYSITLSDSVFALEVDAVIFVKVRISLKEKFVSFARNSLCVSSCLKIAGDYSYMLDASFANIRLLNDFLQTLESEFGETKVNLVLEKEFINRPPVGLIKNNI